MIYTHHTLFCRSYDHSGDWQGQLFVANFATAGIDEEQQQDLAIYSLRNGVIDILSQLHAWNRRIDARTEWWCETDSTFTIDDVFPEGASVG